MKVFQNCNNYRNRFIIAIVLKIRKLRRCQICVCCVRFFAMFATFQCEFDDYSMRTQWIFVIVDYLNKVHFELQNESSLIYFIYRVQMLLKCEIVDIAKQLRNVDFRNFIKFKFNFEILHEIFLKKFTNKFVWQMNIFRLFCI